jgi:hypothetical protein
MRPVVASSQRCEALPWSDGDIGTSAGQRQRVRVQDPQCRRRAGSAPLDNKARKVRRDRAMLGCESAVAMMVALDGSRSSRPRNLRPAGYEALVGDAERRLFEQ